MGFSDLFGKRPVKTVYKNRCKSVGIEIGHCFCSSVALLAIVLEKRLT